MGTGLVVMRSDKRGVVPSGIAVHGARVVVE